MFGINKKKIIKDFLDGMIGKWYEVYLVGYRMGKAGKKPYTLKQFDEIQRTHANKRVKI
jgi:hypothetical protein